jgi:predicted alpha/beta-hydrolase family hydrolase
MSPSNERLAPNPSARRESVTGAEVEIVVTTPAGPGQVRLDRTSGRGRPKGLLVLGHGASGGIDAPDLVAVTHAAVSAGIVVARTTQPYRMAGRRVPPAPPVLDEAFRALVADVRARVGVKLPFVVGGRSSGARVACRTAAGLGARGALALAFPLHPPGKAETTRAGELDPTIATLVVNGDRDPFGVPEAVGEVQVVVRPGNGHDLRRDLAATAELCVTWILRTLAA